MAYRLTEVEQNINRLDDNGKVDLKYTVYDTKKLKTQMVAYRIQHNNPDIIVLHTLMSLLDKADEYQTRTSIAQKEAMIDRLMNEKILLDRKYEPSSGIELLRKDNTCISINQDGSVKVLHGSFYEQFMFPIEQKAAVEMSFDVWERVRMEQNINEHQIPELIDFISNLNK